MLHSSESHSPQIQIPGHWKYENSGNMVINTSHIDTCGCQNPWPNQQRSNGPVLGVNFQRKSFTNLRCATYFVAHSKMVVSGKHLINSSLGYTGLGGSILKPPRPTINLMQKKDLPEGDATISCDSKDYH